ncbi:unnamed protein product [Meloidogyne enterolobii]|uniref:Uncharacterized protein n=1 Tax=Meloidogyne enterolobii TaxID=390850 RepID=A0ACB1AWN9_MELEN
MSSGTTAAASLRSPRANYNLKYLPFFMIRRRIRNIGFDIGGRARKKISQRNQDCPHHLMIIHYFIDQFLLKYRV